MALIELEAVTKEYQLGRTTVRALRGVNLQVERGEFTTVAGASGSGKSTLLNLIGCLDTPTAGRILINGKSSGAMSERQLDQFRLRTIGFIFQSFNLIPVLTVAENVELPLLITKAVSAAERKERVAHFVDAVGLAAMSGRKPDELSGGQRQRVAVARALVTKPEIVLADEPTANLDSTTGVEIIDLMHEICRRESTTFLFSTHDPKLMQRADRIVHLEDGVVAEEERP